MKKIFKSLVVSILTFEAALLLKRKQPTIIGITGSVGKTSTKDAIYCAIKGSATVRKSEKGFNTEIGVPLTVLGLSNGWSNPFIWCKNIMDGFFTAFFSSSYPEILVLEMGVDHPGDMKRLANWIKPDIVVLTRLPEVPVHVEFFKTPDAVVAEKMQLVAALKSDGQFVYNADDTIIEKQRPDVRQKQIGFSRYLHSDFTARTDKIVYHDNIPQAIEFSIEHDGNMHDIRIKGTVGTQQLYAATAAFATASALGIDLSVAAKNLHDLKTPPGRMRLIPGLKSTTLIDDSYNSSPIAAEAALQSLNEIKYAKRKIAILGDMLELGTFSADEHFKIGVKAAESAHVLLTIGVRARKIAEGALSNGMSEENIFQYDDVARAGRELQAMLRSGDVVLIKASQGIRAERIVEEVMNEPERAEELLVRQDTAWKRKV